MYNLTFLTYCAIDFFPSAAVVFGAPLLFPFILTGLIIYHLIRKYLLPNLLKNWSLLDLFEKASRHFFDKVLHRSKLFPEQYVVSGYRAPRWYIYWLFSLLYGMIAFAIALFWDNFVLSEVNFCKAGDEENQACFNMPPSYLDIEWFAYPLTNCDDINNLTDYTLLCFEFEFGFDKATAAAGGVFILASLVLTIITILILNCANNTDTTTPHGSCKRHFRRSLALIFQLIGITASIVIPIGLFINPFVTSTLYRNPRSLLKMLSAVYLILFAWTTPWCWFVEEDIHTKKHRVRRMVKEIREGIAERKPLIEGEETTIQTLQSTVISGLDQILTSDEETEQDRKLVTK